MFSNILKNIRLELGYSQEQFATVLQNNSSVLRKVDAVTLSRWERQQTTPSLAKQAEVIELFDKDIFELYRADASYREECLKILKIGADKNLHPYYSGQAFHIHEGLGYEGLLEDWHDALINYEGNEEINIDYAGLSDEQKTRVRTLIVTTDNNQIIGHCLYISCSQKKNWEFLNGAINLNQAIGHVSSENWTPQNATIVLSMFGANTCIENNVLAKYLGKVLMSKSVDLSSVITKKLPLCKRFNQLGLHPIKVRKSEDGEKLYCFSVSRSELLANEYLFKLGVAGSALR